MGRKAWLLGALGTLSVVLLVSGAMLATSARSLAPWEEELNRYRAYRGSVSSDGVAVESSVRAKRPWTFEREMSATVLGDSLIYQTDIRYHQRAAKDLGLVATPGEVMSYTLLGGEADLSPPAWTSATDRAGRMPLPFPPTDVWCVLLQVQPPTAGAEIEREMVFVAQHRDVYSADWVVHESAQAPFGPQMAESLSRIGCDLPLQP